LTCNLSAVPKETWGRRKTLSAVVVSVLPVITKATTTRRNIVLRDEHGECLACVWGNHTQMLNEATIGRAVTFLRVCIQEYEGAIQLSMPKDSSISIGNTPLTASIMTWFAPSVQLPMFHNCSDAHNRFHNSGDTMRSVQDALDILEPSVMGIHGILARVATGSCTPFLPHYTA
jgi:hypothetical protein